MKTAYGGHGPYLTARGRQDRSGAVAQRAHEVWPEYRRHALRLDGEHSPPGTTPILDRLEGFSPTRGLVFGSYGEGSSDVHSLIEAAARAKARRIWRALGARSESEAYGMVVAGMRRSRARCWAVRHGLC